MLCDACVRGAVAGVGGLYTDILAPVVVGFPAERRCIPCAPLLLRCSALNGVKQAIPVPCAGAAVKADQRRMHVCDAHHDEVRLAESWWS